MNSLLITPTSEAEFNLLVALLEKMQIRAKVLTEEQQEEAGMALLMQQAQGSPLVSRAAVMQALGRS